MWCLETGDPAMRIVVLVSVIALALTPLACGDGEKSDQPSAPSGTDTAKAYDAGLDFLESQATDNNFKDPGFTGIAITPFLIRPGGVREKDQALIDGAIEYLLSFKKPNGGIFGKGVANYATCVAIMALVKDDPKAHKEAIDDAVKFVKSLQALSGGIGYSDKVGPEDPDISNTQFAVEALRKAGVPKEDPVYSKTLKFLETIQNRSESNTGEYRLEDGRLIVPMDDGGAYYKPTESKAGDPIENPDGTVSLRSYGSPTYAMLKCYLLAGLEPSDGRVKDAVKWISNNFTLEENPGFDTSKDPKAGMQGYYYYLMTMAKALDLLGQDKIVDGDGVEHDWKKELAAEILSRQQEDGSWVNTDKDRWFEGMPVLATSYALTALSYCMD
jgi:squalene-hopene/tetraprenyl-beta-curcumene cyclase